MNPRQTLLGALAGALGAASFLVLHAVVIVPIWSSAGSGLVSGAVAGAIMGAGLALVYPRPRIADGLRAGAMLWGGLALVAILVQVVRRGIGRPPEAVEVISAIVVVAAWGAFVGYRIGRSRWAAAGGAIAQVVVLLMSAGPLTTTTVAGITIFASLLPVLALFGLTWAAIRGLSTRSWFACISPGRLSPDPVQTLIP